MKKTINYVIVLAIFTILFNGCAKDGAPGLNGNNGATGATGPTGNTGNLIKGNLYGYSRKYDQDGSQILSGLTTIKISLSGTTNLVTYPDSTGKYSFMNIPYGTYKIDFSDTLYGSNEVNNLPFTGGDYWVKSTVNLSKIPNYHVTTLAIQDFPTYISVAGTVDTNGQTGNRAVILFIGNTNATSSDPTKFLTYYPTNNIGGGNFYIQIPSTDLIDAGFTSGQTVYFAAYGISVGFSSSSVYQDLATGKIVVTGINPQVFTASHIIP